MITSQQFYEAVKLISDYKSQIELGIFEEDSSRTNLFIVNIQKDISKSTFFAIKNYYSDVLNVNLDHKDLKVMNLETLKKLDFKRLRCYRGFGEKAELKFKQLIDALSSKSQNITD
jgi:hypothetical protein